MDYEDLVKVFHHHTYDIWALASALAPSGKESPRKNENPVFYLVKKYYS